MKTPLIAINGRFLTQGVTGVQRYALEMVLELATLARNYKFVVIAPRGRLVSEVPNLHQDNLPLGGLFWEQARLPWILKKIGADLLWCPGFTAPLLNFGIPLVVTFHDAAIFAGPEWFSATFVSYYRFLLPLVGRLANKVVTDSNFSRGELVKYGLVRNADNIEVVYCGLRPLRAKPNESPKPLEQLQERNYVLSLGSRDPRKNISRLVLAWNNLPDQVKKGRILAIGGKGAKIFSKEQLAGVQKDVVFLGYVPDEHLFGLYKQADIFALPSLYEGFGFPALEAMSCGTPVLASIKGSLPEVCGDAALYCDPYNIDDIAGKLSQLLTDKSLAEKLGKRGVERAKRFTWEKSATQLLDIFEKILRKG